VIFDSMTIVAETSVCDYRSIPLGYQRRVRSVPPAVSGWVKRSTRELTADPPAHAGGTDFVMRFEQHELEFVRYRVQINQNSFGATAQLFRPGRFDLGPL
jgi:hypothetical protein